MSFSKEGIGWLIAGGIICASAIGSGGPADVIGTMLIGLVFVAIYLMKQVFDPVGKGWFIGGGLLVAFCVETSMDTAKGMLSEFFVDYDSLSTILIALIFAASCLGVFYYKNRDGIGELFDIPVYNDETDEAEIEVVSETEYTSDTESTSVSERAFTSEEKHVSDAEGTSGAEHTFKCDAKHVSDTGGTRKTKYRFHNGNSGRETDTGESADTEYSLNIGDSGRETDTGETADTEYKFHTGNSVRKSDTDEMDDIIEMDVIDIL